MRKSVRIESFIGRAASRVAIAIMAVGCSSSGGEPSQPSETGAQENAGNPAAAGARSSANATTPDAPGILLAELTPEANHVIQFWEIAPGRVTIGERAAIGVAPRITDKLRSRHRSYVDIYEALAGTKAPHALIAAQARQTALEATLAKEFSSGTSNISPPAMPPSAAKGASERSGSETHQPQSDDAAWFLANFCQPTPQALRHCITDVEIVDARDRKVLLTDVGSAWAVATLACLQFTGRCVLGISDRQPDGHYGGPFQGIPPREWFQYSATGVSTREVWYNGGSATDLPGLVGKVAVGMQWNPFPPPAGDCNWAGKFCCDPGRTGSGFCDTAWDSFLFCDPWTNLCVTP